MKYQEKRQKANTNKHNKTRIQPKNNNKRNINQKATEIHQTKYQKYEITSDNTPKNNESENTRMNIQETARNTKNKRRITCTNKHNKTTKHNKNQHNTYRKYTKTQQQKRQKYQKYNNIKK